MYTYWTRRPITKAVRVNSIGAVQHWLDSLSAEDKTAGSSFSSNFVVSSPDPATWRVDYDYDDGTGAGGPLYVEAPFGYFVVLGGNATLGAMAAAEFSSQYEPTVGV